MFQSAQVHASIFKKEKPTQIKRDSVQRKLWTQESLNMAIEVYMQNSGVALRNLAKTYSIPKSTLTRHIYKMTNKYNITSMRDDKKLDN